MKRWFRNINEYIKCYIVRKVDPIIWRMFDDCPTVRKLFTLCRAFDQRIQLYTFPQRYKHQTDLSILDVKTVAKQLFDRRRLDMVTTCDNDCVLVVMSSSFKLCPGYY
eukprot:GILJ01050773.1.p1 GENE.GILJ01050773.1~~GILJ01050773.1.p1  ORF type:complete len:108 (-),score=3.97 GILJ01050773.1:28-351(-)